MTANTINKTYDLKSNQLQHEVKAAVNAQFFKSTYEKKLSEIMKGFKLPGFRPGKVPKSLLSKRYGPEILKESAEEVVEKSFGEILDKEKLQIAAQPKLDLQTVKIGSDLEYSAEFESMPVIEPIAFDKITIERPVIALASKDIEQVVQEQITASPTWKATKKPVKNTDKVKVDFEGKVDGKVFEGGEGKDIELVIGEGKFLKDFEAGVVGAKAGDKLQIDVKFPESYHQKNLAGCDAVFNVNIVDVWEAKYHKLDQEWFKKQGSNASTKKEFLEEMQPRQQLQADKVANKITRDYISDKLSEIVEFPVPTALIERELKNESAEVDKLTDKERAEKKAQVTKHLRYLLLIQHLVDTFKIEASPAELELYLESVMPAGIDMNFFKSWYVQDKERVEKIRIAVLEEKVLDHVRDLCKLKEVKMSLAAAKKLLNKEK